MLLVDLPRREQHVNDVIRILGEHLEDCKGDSKKALDTLNAEQAELVNAELSLVSGNDPVSLRYYLDNYHIINTKGEGEPPRLQTLAPFKESQEILWADFIYCIENKIPVYWILLKARQVGWSTLVQAMIFYRTIFNPLMNSLVIADERVRSGWIFDMSRLAYDNLPYWMQPELQYEVKGDHVKFDRKDKEERMRRPGLRSALYCDAANKPSGSSRGMTLHCLHASEVSRYTNAAILSSDILPAVPENNPLTIACLEGTAEGRQYFYRKLWESAVKGRNKQWRPVFTGWWQEKTYSRPFRTTVEENEFVFNEEERDIALKVKDEFGHVITPAQMNWRRNKGQFFEDNEGDFEKVEQEYPSYPESAFRSSGRSFFPKKRLASIEKRYVRRPEWFGELQAVKDGETTAKKWVKYTDLFESPLWIWEWPREGVVYYLGADPGHGIPGDDYSAISIWKIPMHPSSPYIQVAEYQGYADPTAFARLIALLGEFYNQCEIAPECNTITQVIGDLLNVHNYPSIYRWRRNDKVKGRFTNYFGWETNAKSRNLMMSRFRTNMLQDLVIIRSSRLMDEAYNFVDDGTGRFEAADDSYDDVLVAAMICNTCMMDFDPALVLQQSVSKEKSALDFYNSDYSPEFDGERKIEIGAPEFSNL
jgi:hypothetical protein